MNSYVRGELKFEDDLPYELLAGVQPWNYGARNTYASAGDRLAGIMNQNPYMKILVLGGRCDLVCPIDTVHYALDHMQLDPAYRTNITYAEFDAGHMMYINLPDLKKMRQTVEEFSEDEFLNRNDELIPNAPSKNVANRLLTFRII